MKFCRALFFFLIICLLAASSSSAMSKRPKMGVDPDRGVEAPDFTLNDLDGNPVKLSNFRGKVVFINFFSLECSPCREELPSMDRLNTEMSGKAFQMLAVNLDRVAPAQIKAYMMNGRLNFMVLHDTDGFVAYGFGASRIPLTLIIDKKGIVVAKVLGARDWADEGVISEIEKLIAE